MTAVLVRGRDDVLTVMRKGREARGLTHLEMDEMVGLGSGHYGKIERMGAGWGKCAIRLSPSILNCLDALGFELVIAPKGEVQAETVARDVRLIPEATNVVQLMSGSPAPERPGWVGQWLRDRYEANKPRAKKRPATAGAARAEAGGATC